MKTLKYQYCFIAINCFSDPMTSQVNFKDGKIEASCNLISVQIVKK